jgi:hypothetical protein
MKNDIYEDEVSDLDNILAYAAEFKKKLFPDWLEKEEEFKKLRDTKGNYGINNIFAICQKRVVDRTDIDNGHTFEYLKSRASYFSSNFIRDVIKQIATKLTAKFVKAGDVIFEKNSIGSEMYIIYNGQVGLFAGGDLIASIVYNNVFGEKVIENTKIRSATAKALTDCELLLLNVDDFRNVLTNQSVQLIQENRLCISNVACFKEWEPMKRDRL